VIRDARPSDAPRIAVLTGQLGYPATEAEIRSRLTVLGSRGEQAFYVAEVDGIVAGWIGVRTDLSLEGGAYAEVVGLVVDEARRGRGIGEDLVLAAEAWAHARGATRLRVRSNVIRERAHHFYERLGYTITKRQAVFDKQVDGD
jgi:ribosomal protein S18 acetylase RimI-like enzyme